MVRVVIDGLVSMDLHAFRSLIGEKIDCCEFGLEDRSLLVVKTTS